jgi:hypothetical protein
MTLFLENKWLVLYMISALFIYTNALKIISHFGAHICLICDASAIWRLSATQIEVRSAGTWRINQSASRGRRGSAEDAFAEIAPG